MAGEAETVAGSDSGNEDQGSEKCSWYGQNWLWFLIIIAVIVVCLFAYWSMV
jgi:hypothetical protein